MPSSNMVVRKVKKYLMKEFHVDTVTHHGIQEMNKPIEVRGKKNKHQQRGTAQDELKQILTGTNEEIAAAATTGISAEEVGELRESLGEPEQLPEGTVIEGKHPFTISDPSWQEVNGPLELKLSFDYTAHEAATQADKASVSFEDAVASAATAQASGVTAGGPLSTEEFTELYGQPSGVIGAVRAHSEPVVTEREAKVSVILEQAKEMLVNRRADIPNLTSFVHDLAERLEAVGLYDNLEDWVKNQAFFTKNLILVVLRSPKSIPSIPDGTIKRVLELHPYEITGLARGYNLGTKAGNRLDYQGSNSDVQMGFGEKYGRVLGKMFESWGERLGAIGASDNTTVDFMLIEPDPTHTIVVDAWLCKDMYPSGCSSIDASRDLNAHRTAGYIYVPWLGSVTRGAGVETQAQSLLDELAVGTANPYAQAAAVDALEAQVQEVSGG